MNSVKNHGNDKSQKPMQKNNLDITHIDNDERIHNPRHISNGIKLIFVYNSDGTLGSLIKDTAHKIVSPKTYPCNLCRITYHGVTIQEDWQKFIQSLPHEVVFFHRDEFRKQYPNQKDGQFPAVFVPNATGFKLLVPHTEINKAQSVHDLIKTVKTLS